MRTNPPALGVPTLVETNVRRLTQIVGPVLDVAFPPGKITNIYIYMYRERERERDQIQHEICPESSL